MASDVWYAIKAVKSTFQQLFFHRNSLDIENSRIEKCQNAYKSEYDWHETYEKKV